MSASVGDEGLDVNLTPLLDLVLQLIMFFMITVNFVRVDQFDKSIQLPASTQAVPMDKRDEEWLFLNLDADGNLVGALKNEKLTTEGKLLAYLQRERESLKAASARLGKKDVKIVVILRADQQCKTENVWYYLKAFETAGFEHWQLRALTKKK